MNTFRLNRPYKIALWLVFFLAVGGILGGLYMYNLKDKDLKDAKPDFKMTAAELQGAFETDEASAGAAYINKIIEVSGEVENVKQGENQTTVITLKTENPLSSVSCSFEAGSGKPDLAAGDQATIRGRCSGFLMDVQLNNCSSVNKEN